jgi:hypothetical protein
VFRLFDSTPEEHWPELFEHLRATRPELEPRATADVGEIIAVRSPAYVADAPLDPLGYARRVAVLEYLLGLPRGGAQDMVDAEILQRGAA